MARVRTGRRACAPFDLFAEALVQHATGPQGRDGLRQTLATLDGDLDHPTAAVHRVIAQDDLVVVHLTMHGRHVASTMPLLAALPPRGKPSRGTSSTSGGSPTVRSSSTGP